MKKFFVLSVLLLNACAAAPKSPTEWSSSNGMGFDKANFSYEEYTGHSYDCFAISQRMNNSNPSKQKQGYEGCMKTRGYSFTSLPLEEIRKRDLALSNYMKMRTPTENNFFDKDDFQDAAFANDMRECLEGANTMKADNVPNIQGTLAGAAVSGFVMGQDKSQKKRSYLQSCMVGKGYIMTDMPQSEIKRRQNLIR